jgi:hypothetical protein
MWLENVLYIGLLWFFVVQRKKNKCSQPPENGRITFEQKLTIFWLKQDSGNTLQKDDIYRKCSLTLLFLCLAKCVTNSFEQQWHIDTKKYNLKDFFIAYARFSMYDAYVQHALVKCNQM